MQQTTRQIKELQRRPAPAGRPQPLALYENLLWTGSWDTDRIYGIDPENWAVVEDVAAPGKPYGLAALDGVLFVVVSDDSEADDRYLYRFTRDRGFDASSKTPCPDFTGSHLTSDGSKLYLTQAHNGRILTLDKGAHVLAEFPLPTRSAGFGFGLDGKLYMISADEEFEDLKFGTLDLQAKPPAFAPIASFAFGARSLAYDGSIWYTSDREVGEIVSFTVE